MVLWQLYLEKEQVCWWWREGGGRFAPPRFYRSRLSQIEFADEREILAE